MFQGIFSARDMDAVSTIMGVVAPSKISENFENRTSLRGLSLFMSLLLYKLIIIAIVMMVGTALWNMFLTKMIPGLAPTSALGIFALWVFVGIMLR